MSEMKPAAKRTRFRRATCLFCASVLFATAALEPGLGAGVAVAQTAAVTAGTAAPKALFITILEGEGDLNDIRARTAREPIVQVEDENHRPVAGALVLFSADPNGSTQLVNFSGSQSISVQTGADGRATANGLQTFHHTGNVRILVTATVGAVVATAIIHQRNVASGGKLKRSVSHHKLLFGSLLVAGGVLAAVLLTRSSGTTIQAGTGTVGR